jgi:hypothetical protein
MFFYYYHSKTSLAKGLLSSKRQKALNAVADKSREDELESRTLQPTRLRPAKMSMTIN